MGMAASQARLLSLTMRMSDIELTAQRLQSQKLALATQKDELYERYCDALEATTLKVAFWNANGSTSLIQANFNTVCGYNEYRCRQYALQSNKTGLAIVPEDVKRNYDEYANDKYSFAWAMMGFEGFNYLDGYTTSRDTGKGVGYYNNKAQTDFEGFPYADGSVLHMTQAEAKAYEAIIEAYSSTSQSNNSNNNIVPIYISGFTLKNNLTISKTPNIPTATAAETTGPIGVNINNTNSKYVVKQIPGTVTTGASGTTGSTNNTTTTTTPQEVITLQDKYSKIAEARTTAEKQKALDDFREYFYTHFGDKIFTEMNWSKQTYENDKEAVTDTTWNNIQDEFNYYVQMWSMINECGGCETIDAQYQDGEEGNTWFNNVVEAGLVSILEFNPTSKKWSQTSPATSTNGNYLQEVQDDKDLKKAEAEYEHELDIINRKDTKFDTELSKLETERTAIKTEIDSIKQVRDDNIDRTFKLFS